MPATYLDVSQMMMVLYYLYSPIIIASQPQRPPLLRLIVYHLVPS